MSPTGLEDIEREAYQESFSDGLLDIFVGMSLVSVGVTWLWIQQLPGLAGVLPALLAGAILPIRRRLLAPRMGHVTWRAPRLRQERRQLGFLLVLVLAAALSGNGAIEAIREGGTQQGTGAGLPAFILAAGALAMAAMVGVRRLWAYGGVLAAAAAVTLLVEANPGGALLVSGSVIVCTGAVLLAGFLRNHPVRNPE